jgi:hypothetical protein
MIGTDGILQWVIAGGMLSVAGFSMATYRYVGKSKDDDEKKHARIYERLDEVKKASDEKFVPNKICDILHTQSTRDLVEIKADLKLLLKHNGIKDE